jgi:Lanthionine synthetase C-like protein
MIRGGLLWRAAEHEELTDRPWAEGEARGAIEAIVLDAGRGMSDGFWPGHPLDEVGSDERFGSLYLGSAGMVWALWKLGASFDYSAVLRSALERYRAEPDFGGEAHAPSLLMGETGLLVVAARVGSPAADRERLRRLVVENRAHPTWELMWGSPGTILAARACELHAEWEESASLLCAQWDAASDLWTQDLYGRTSQILGPVHGFAGNVHALRGYVADDVLRERTTKLLERMAQREDGLVNWLPGVGDPKVRVQWCHGAPGIISTVGDLIPRGLALAGGELTWRAGPLRKGPGLCHGTAGNGFAFLKLYELTGDERWLCRARRFAMHAIGQVERQRVEHGRGRYTLLTGDIGVALYLKACLEAEAAFPIIDSL